MKGHAEILAKGCKLEIARDWFVSVFVEIPHRSLERTEHLVSCWKEGVQALVPRLNEGGIEACIVGHELGNKVGLSIGGEHGNGGMAAKEVCEIGCHLLG